MALLESPEAFCNAEGKIRPCGGRLRKREDLFVLQVDEDGVRIGSPDIDPQADGVAHGLLRKRRFRLVQGFRVRAFSTALAASGE